jgi:deoxyribodipyrimidine photo-lyase
LRRSEPDLDPDDDLPRFDPHDLAGTLARLRVDRSVVPVAGATGGTRAAKRELRRFLDERFATYAAHRNQPQTDDVSHLSKPLHYGHLSPVTAALWAREAAPGSDALDAFLEELIVRRELAINFVLHAEADYDRYETLPAWARTTLDEHRDDRREHVYDDAAFENAETHDPYWNAAMREMRATGYMHNYMRMYWGKKILEWSASPEEAFERAQRLNDRWFLDGRDPNSYAGVAWCFGLHDRGWTERPVYGKVRYMNANGLRRKADPDAYVEKVAAREREEAQADRGRFGETGAGGDAG